MICRGAEGTVVEGGDLATKVWGLESDEGHRFRLKSPQPFKSSSSSAPLPLGYNSDYQTVTSSALARHRDAVIDLVKPSTFCCYPEAYDSTGGRMVSFDGACSSPAGHAGNLCAHTRSYQDMHSANVTTASTGDCPERASTALGKELVGRSQGLPRIIRFPGFTRQSSLNSAAPSFVPAYLDSKRACIQQDAEFDDFEYTHTARDLGQQHASNSDLTPASTASPLWSPVFQSVPTIVLGDCDPRIYIPQDPDSYSNKFITQQLNNEEFMIVQQRLHAEQGIKASIETFYSQPYVANNRICMKSGNDVDATPSPTLSSCGLTEANQTESCERRGHLSHQPRSVPMARLMQRRLSSVVEENKSGSYETVHAKTVDRRSALVSGQCKVSNAQDTEISAGGELSTSIGR